MELNKEDIIQILRNHETETYPNGVGSIFRCIKNSRYNSIANQIINKLNK